NKRARTIAGVALRVAHETTHIPTIRLPAAKRFRLHHKHSHLQFTHSQPQLFIAAFHNNPASYIQYSSCGRALAAFISPSDKERFQSERLQRKGQTDTRESPLQDKEGRENQDPICKSLQSGHRRICTGENNNVQV
ncbi:unnamed protein product, partial [Ectocarpus sp. 8 AP-2014]